MPGQDSGMLPGGDVLLRLRREFTMPVALTRAIARATAAPRLVHTLNGSGPLSGAR